MAFLFCLVPQYQKCTLSLFVFYHLAEVQSYSFSMHRNNRRKINTNLAIAKSSRDNRDDFYTI